MWTGVLLLILGVWLIAQALVGDLGGRILSYAGMGPF